MADEQQEGAQEETTVSQKEYQNLQRKLSRSQDQVRELTRENVDSSRALAATSRIETVLEKQLEMSGEEETLTAFRARQKGDNESFGYRSELIAVLREYDVDMDDEKLASARTLWDEGRGAEAVAEARKAMGAIGASDIEARVQEEVAKIRRAEASGVDDGDSSGPSSNGGQRGITRGDLGNPYKAGQSPKQLITDARSALDKYYRT